MWFSKLLLKTIETGSRKTAQLAKYLIRKDKDLTLDPNHPCDWAWWFTPSYTVVKMAILSRMTGSFDYELWYPEPWIKTTLCLYKLVVVDISLCYTKPMLITNGADFYFPCDIAGTSLLCLFCSLCVLFAEMSFFFVLSSCKGSLSILETSPLSDGTW